MARTVKPTGSDATENALNAAQILFSLSPAYRPQAKHLTQAQAQILKEAEEFSSAWFRRRHEAMRSAMEVTAQIAAKGLQNPTEAMKAMTEWQIRSMERLAEDAKDCTEFMSRCAGSLIAHEIEAVDETAKEAKQAMTTKHATPV